MVDLRRPAAALQWVDRGDEAFDDPPPELAGLHPNDRAAFWNTALTCDPEVRDGILAAVPPPDEAS